MTLNHIGIWTDQLEELRAYYIEYFGGVSGNKYINEKRQFSSYFLAFGACGGIEIMSMPEVPDNLNDTVVKQHKGLIHLAFKVKTKADVDRKAKELEDAGYPILSGPRRTGDGFYEFETLDPDNNRVEVTTPFVEDQTFTI